MVSTMAQTRFRIEGMDCAGCATKIDTAVRRTPGVTDVAVSVTAGTMTVSHDGSSDLAAIERKVTGLGYKIGAPSDSKIASTVSEPGLSLGKVPAIMTFPCAPVMR